MKHWMRLIFVIATLAVLGALMSMALIPMASALEVIGNPSASFTFDKPKAENPTFTDTTSFTLRNTKNATVSFSITDTSSESGITVEAAPSSDVIKPYDSVVVSLVVEVECRLSEGEHNGEVTVTSDDGTYTIPISISISHSVKLEVSPLFVDFGKVDVDEGATASVTFKETLGYKSVNVSLSGGDNWVQPSESSFPVDASGSKTISFYLAENKPGWESYRRFYSWSFSVTSEGGTYNIKLEAELLLPPKLSVGRSASCTVTFNKPKSGKPTFRKNFYIPVKNQGYYSMNINRVSLSGFSSKPKVTVDYPSSVGSYSTKNIALSIEAPYDTREGTYSGKVDIDAGSAGSADVSVSIKIKYGVGLEVSPTSKNFGGVEIFTEERDVKLTLRETFGYKSINNVLIKKISGPGWISISPASIPGIPPEGSDIVTFTLKFRGEAETGKEYKWVYSVETENAGSKTMTVLAETLPPDLSAVISELNSLKSGSTAHYPVTGTAISKSLSMLDAAKKKELSAEDWNFVMSTSTQTVTVLNLLNKYSDSEDKSMAFSNLRSGAALSEFVSGSAYSISDGGVRSHAKKSVEALDNLVDNMLSEAASYFESRGHNYENTNYLEAAKAYKCAASAYELLGNTKCETYKHSFEEMVRQHDDLVISANENRVNAERELMLLEPELTEIGSVHLLLNPFAYDDVSSGYDSALSTYSGVIDKYGHAGEVRMKSDAENRFSELKKDWKSISTLFFAYMMFLSIIFVLVVFRLSKGVVDYLRDSGEIMLGDVVNP